MMSSWVGGSGGASPFSQRFALAIQVPSTGTGCSVGLNSSRRSRWKSCTTRTAIGRARSRSISVFGSSGAVALAPCSTARALVSGCWISSRDWP